MYSLIIAPNDIFFIPSVNFVIVSEIHFMAPSNATIPGAPGANSFVNVSATPSNTIVNLSNIPLSINAFTILFLMF